MLVSAGKKHRFPFITKSREDKGGSKEPPSTSSYPSSLATLALPAPPSSTFTSSSSSSGSSSSKHNYGTQQLALEFYPKEELVHTYIWIVSKILFPKQLIKY
jgi:hypothetical protein